MTTPESENLEARREALFEKLDLKGQYEAQLKVLNEAGVLEILPESQEMGIVGIDGKEHPIPTLKEIKDEIDRNLYVIEDKSEQGFTKLLLVPHAVPLDVLIERYEQLLTSKHREGLLKNPDGSSLDLREKDPVFVQQNVRDAEKKGSAMYYPDDENHYVRAATKKKMLALGEFWEMMLVEPEASIPEPGEGETKGKRKQLEKGLENAESYRKRLQDDGGWVEHRHETGLTLEAWLALAMSSLVENNTQIDTVDSSSHSFAANVTPGTSIKAASGVKYPTAYCSVKKRQVMLSMVDVNSSEKISVRMSVRI
ncbi:hypothetical protein ACFL2D_00845 [Patescibacteria group bacterium]